LTRPEVLVLLVLGMFLLTAGAPLASEPKEQANRALCKANLAKIGKAMLIYAGDHDGALPRAGGPTTVWRGLGINWAASSRYTAYGVTVGANEGGGASISSCFYLLVKYLEMPTKVFVCPSDANTVPFKLADEGINSTSFRLIDAWDFGDDPSDNCSYAYHIPFGKYALKTSRDPNLAVAADRNPWIASPARTVVDQDRWARFLPEISPYFGRVEQARRGNSITHKDDGQNVLFLDGRVTFEQRACCGLDDDNIYTVSSMREKGDPRGNPVSGYPRLSGRNERDSLLVHDPDEFPPNQRARRR
jgi:hypothetical protein